MNAYAEHAEYLQSLQGELGDDCPTIWYGGKAVRVLPGTARHGNQNGIGGQMIDSDLEVVCIASDFGATPEADQTFRYPGKSGKKFLIANVFTAPGGKQIRLSGIDASGGV